MDPTRYDPKLVPTEDKHLAACCQCRLILNERQWTKLDGACPNCKSSHTELTVDFVGMVSLIQPTHSWVAKWNDLKKRVPGVYAISVGGPVERQEVIGGGAYGAAPRRRTNKYESSYDSEGSGDRDFIDDEGVDEIGD